MAENLETAAWYSSGIDGRAADSAVNCWVVASCVKSSVAWRTAIHG